MVAFNQYKAFCREEEEKFIALLQDPTPSQVWETQAEDENSDEQENALLESVAVSSEEMSFINESSGYSTCSNSDDGMGDTSDSSSAVDENQSAQGAYDKFKNKANFVRAQLQK